jgi:hypothetical protein
MYEAIARFGRLDIITNARKDAKRWASIRALRSTEQCNQLRNAVSGSFRNCRVSIRIVRLVFN